MRVILLEVAMVASASAALSDQDMYMSTYRNQARPVQENKEYFDLQPQKNFYQEYDRNAYGSNQLQSQDSATNLSRYRSNKSERRRRKQQDNESHFAYDDKIGYYWVNLESKSNPAESSDASDNESPDFLKYFQNLIGEPYYADSNSLKDMVRSAENRE